MITEADKLSAKEDLSQQIFSKQLIMQFLFQSSLTGKSYNEVVNNYSDAAKIFTQIFDEL